MSIQFINITEEEFLSKKLLYKYMPLEFALSTIVEKYLWMCNPVKWKDPFEKRFIQAKYIVGDTESDFPIKGQVFCFCMTQTTSSEAHWLNYANGQTGISFRFRREALLEVLEKHTADYDIYVGRVDYLITNDLTKKKLSEIAPIRAITPFELDNRELQIHLLLLKRIAFRYEDEIRILAVKKQKTKETGIKLTYDIPPQYLIDTITLDPNVGQNTESMLKRLFKEEYGFKKVYKSTLYSMPKIIKIEM